MGNIQGSFSITFSSMFNIRPIKELFIDEIFPVKTRKIHENDDQPWVSFKLKQMDRKQKEFFTKKRYP